MVRHVVPRSLPALERVEGVGEVKVGHEVCCHFTPGLVVTLHPGSHSTPQRSVNLQPAGHSTVHQIKNQSTRDATPSHTTVE